MKGDVLRMRKRDRKALARYVRAVADEMGLRDWTFEIEIGDADVELPWETISSCASIECVDGRKFATVTFPEDTRHRSREELRDTVAHELIHAHLNPACEIVRVDAKDGFSQATYEVMMAGFRRNIEFAVDGLAEAFAPHMPLIDWSQGKAT